MRAGRRLSNWLAASFPERRFSVGLGGMTVPGVGARNCRQSEASMLHLIPIAYKFAPGRCLLFAARIELHREAKKCPSSLGNRRPEFFLELRARLMQLSNAECPSPGGA